MVVVKRSAFSAFPSARNESEGKKKKKTPWKRKKKKRKNSIINIILSHVNHTFFYIEPSIGPQALRHTHYTLGKNVFLNVKKGSVKIQFASNWSLGFWSLDPCLKGPLDILMLTRLTMHNEFIKVQSIFFKMVMAKLTILSTWAALTLIILFV
jgi:hypothetical protein